MKISQHYIIDMKTSIQGFLCSVEKPFMCPIEYFHKYLKSVCVFSMAERTQNFEMF